VVRAIGQDGLAVRTGQLRSTRSRPTRIARVAFASTCETLVVALRGSAPRGASCDGPPAPRRLGQPSPCTSPISDVLCRHRGHCLAGSRTGGKLARHTPCGPCLAFTRATETTTTPRLAARYRDNRDAFRRVLIDRVAPAADPTSAFLFECAAQFRAPFSPRSRRLVCQHVGAESSSTSAVSPTCLAAPRASRRAMRRTDFCLLTFFVRAPAPRRFPMRHALARLRDRGDRLPHVSAIRFGGPHVCRVVTAVGVVDPSRCV